MTCLKLRCWLTHRSALSSAFDCLSIVLAVLLPLGSTAAAVENLITLMCCVVSAVGEQNDDDIVIEVHETKWWQKNIEVRLVHAVLKDSIASCCRCYTVTVRPTLIQSRADSIHQGSGKPSRQ